MSNLVISMRKNKFQRVLIYGLPGRRGMEGADGESLSERDFRSSVSKCEVLEIKLILLFV